MRRMLVLLALLGACASLAPDSTCPAQCRCTLNSSGGTIARCSTLDAAEQQFSGNIQRLEVSNIAPQDGWLNTLEDRLFVDLGLSHLDSIKITNTSLKSIDINAFRGLPNLYDLDLSDNNIVIIDPDTFEFSAFLHRLVLAGNPLKPDVSKYLLKSESLTELDISRCNLSTITPEMFSKLDNLIFLNLASNYLKDIGHFWKYKDFEFVEELDLSDNQIQKIDTKILSEHSELVTLNLRKNLLQSFDYVDIPELEDLDISQNRFQEINANTFKNVPEVIHVNMSYNQIHFIAEDSFIHVPNLKHLDLSHNKINGPLPVYMLTKNPDIENLKLSGNKNMKVFTGEEGLSGQHNNLYILDISDCGLEVIKSNSFQRMENIGTLNLSNNAIRTLDADVFSRLKRLSVLDISNNQLLTLNTSLFSANSELRKLIVSGNPLMNFSPKLFMHVHRLHYLDASHCQLSEVWSFRDAAFMNTHKILANLEFFNLSNNNMKHLHINDFGSAHALTTVDIRNNPMSCTKHFTELIQWFISQEIDPERQKNELSTELLDFDNNDRAVEKSIEWKEVIEQVCPTSTDLAISVKKFKNVVGSETIKVIEEEPKQHKKEMTTETTNTDSTLTLLIPGVDLGDIFPANESPEQTEEDPKEKGEELLRYYNIYGWIYWTFVLFVFVLLMAIINLTGALCCRQAPARPSYIGPVGGYVRTKNDGGSLYYKLYEECSVPNTPIVKNKTVVLDFNQFLKKPNAYNIVKDIDTLPSQV
uniref:Insulin-like growth factor-binding protein complex acid labile subunit n=1 Tax=Cacopsylla melanoneura TaxID=428564 RepID=A0A8D8WRN5_9HEMI